VTNHDDHNTAGQPIWPGAPRYYPERPLPPDAYVRGAMPHPRKTLHALLPALPPPTDRLPEHWDKNSLYLYGIDLYHFGFLWESHEAWETLWRALPRLEPQAVFYRALILNSAAQIKLREGRMRGVLTLSRRVHRLLEQVQKDTPLPRYMGMDLARLILDVSRHYGPCWTGDPATQPSSQPPRLVLEA
jgi:uncharacterized protein